jgi:hypothetical protein
MPALRELFPENQATSRAQLAVACVQIEEV